MSKIPNKDIPFFDSPVTCGFPSPAQDYIRERISLDSFLIPHPESTYLLRATGDSMCGVGIMEGDLLVVDCYDEARHGDIVIATLEGEFTCKRLLLRPAPCLMPENPAFSPVPLSDDVETLVFGVVRHVIHSF
ncbi:translesion error-prone DNA polymerase V autoproteolytic subunit [Salmonella enterica]|uniref:Translesion error-prone DNA polymerase V autoproteolytic subunit n=1 Tax=Salmonella enterica TaxID=28901 RepID=A0A5U2F6V7_SALER|nr:DNA polymerase V subunit UmuD [Salmonella enterica]EBH8037508.1 translesion error-prone DNA polymerase V autoproteolytic subunit [Salmonella bongori]ECG0831006.1 DNA polymerase V subunit UmuD [Salmonella enterica subsp. diarizonae]EAP3485598.1 DNA polymerase V subunit UmuD [Salmonella enterica]EBD6774069.1 translesion error-prone DNA polymerase V autoproteolytic subunit [Salmonella enterica]